MYQSNIFSNYQEIISFYKKNECWGLLTSLDAKNCDPTIIRSEYALKKYVSILCDLLDVKRFRETIVEHFGEDEDVEGFSFVQLIETSLVSGHLINKTNTAYIDIFSCKLYDPITAKKFTQSFFKSEDIKINYLFRF